MLQPRLVKPVHHDIDHHGLYTSNHLAATPSQNYRLAGCMHVSIISAFRILAILHMLFAMTIFLSRFSRQTARTYIRHCMGMRIDTPHYLIMGCMATYRCSVSNINICKLHQEDTNTTERHRDTSASCIRETERQQGFRREDARYTDRSILRQ